MIWYGVHKTGIPEIDMDHSNIDSYLNFAQTHGFSSTAFDQLVNALILHYEREEEICQRLQLNMTLEHQAEHQRLTKLLQSLSFDEKDEEEHLLFFKQTLLSHISEFDIHINSGAP